MLAGSQTMSAAIGSAEEAVNAGVVALPAGDQGTGHLDDRAVLRHHLYLGHRRHHPDHQVPAEMVGRGRQGRGARNTRRSTAWRAATRRRSDRLDARGLRAYRLENKAWVGKTIGELLARQPRISDRQRRAGGEPLGPDRRSSLQQGDVIALGGRREAMTEKMGLIGPEVSDRIALDVPLDQADILVTDKECLS